MESNDLRDAIQKQEAWFAGEIMNCSLAEKEASDKIITDLARHHLAVVEKGEVPKKMEVKIISLERADNPTYEEGYEWNACHDAFLPLLVAKEMEIEKLYHHEAENFTLKKEVEELKEQQSTSFIERMAQISAHRACCGSEHDPSQGKLHGYCVVCGVPWPCEYSGKNPAQKSKGMEREELIKVINDYGDKFSKAGVLPKAGELAEAILTKWGGAGNET